MILNRMLMIENQIDYVSFSLFFFLHEVQIVKEYQYYTLLLISVKVYYYYCFLMSRGKILITVGTTQFDALIQYTDSQQFIQLVKQSGYTEDDITYQFGTTGKYVPKHAKNFRLAPNIEQVYRQHEVIVTHGGAGTLLACLYDKNPNKKIIAVSNDTLAGNHQVQLIEKLSKQGYIIGFTGIKQFKKSKQQIKSLLSSKLKLKKYPAPQIDILNQLVFSKND